MVDEEEIKIQFKNLNPKKATTFRNIPGKILKDNSDVYNSTMTVIVNNNITESTYPNKLKLADVNPVFKKVDSTLVENYRPVSVLAYASKIFERIMQKQIMKFMNPHLSKNLCGYREGYSTQHALITMIESWRKSLDNKGYAGAILMDLSKAFDCINHELLLAKLNAYGFHESALQSIHCYLRNRWQRVKIHYSFSHWEELLLGVPQGSVLGPILFNIYLNDLLWFVNEGEVCNFADDTTFYCCNKDLKILLENLELDSSKAIEWFKMNYMKLNTDKCKLIVAGQKDHTVKVKVGDSNIDEQEWVKLLGVKIDNKLTFKIHLKEKLKKANNKIAVIRDIIHI